MSDRTTQLRKVASEIGQCEGCVGCAAVDGLTASADEIERLQERIETLHDMLARLVYASRGTDEWDAAIKAIEDYVVEQTVDEMDKELEEC